MFTKLLKGLEDPSHPLLGPTLWGLKIIGLWQSDKLLSRILYYLIRIGSIFFLFSQYVQLWKIRYDFEQALWNLSVTLLSTVCIVKTITFVLCQRSWKSVINYVSTLEKRQMSMNDNITKRIMRAYTKYSRTITYLYCCLVTITVLAMMVVPFANVISSTGYTELMKNNSVSYPTITSSWLPFDTSRGRGYCILIVEQALNCVHGGAIVAIYDSNAIVLMSFIAGQLKLLKVNCARLFGDGNGKLDKKVALERIHQCYMHHLQLMQIAKMLNSLLSPVMFLYIIICSLMICTSAVQLTKDGVTTMQKISIMEYLLALIVQLFLFCWHSNIVMYVSTQVEDGVYGSAWWAQDIRVRRCILLLAGQLRRPVIFTAGPFANLALSTFITILKGSYSYYTLLSQTEE